MNCKDIEVKNESIFKFKNRKRLLQDEEFFDSSQKVYLIIKRLIGIILSFFLILIFSPLFIIISLLIFFTSKGPVFFIQDRVGKNEKLIKIYKFRTMNVSAPRSIASLDLQNVNSHLTKVGKFLRVTSLDELPQLINVLKGDMSLIGPRPIIPEEAEVHELRKKNNVYLIRPGITGLAQVNGRDFLDPEKKVFYDTNYLENISFINDIKVILRSIIVVFKRSDMLELKEKPNCKKKSSFIN